MFRKIKKYYLNGPFNKILKDSSCNRYEWRFRRDLHVRFLQLKQRNIDAAEEVRGPGPAAGRSRSQRQEKVLLRQND
jgi:hypothetical protein